MCSTDLVISDRFTLPGEAATNSDIDTALAYLARMTWREESDGRQIFTHFTRAFKNTTQDLRYLVLSPDDDRHDIERVKELREEYDCHGVWMPLQNGRCTKMLTDCTCSVLPLTSTENNAYLGQWKITFPQELGDYNRSLANMKLPRVQVGEEYQGYNLLEVICRGILARAGRFKDVYLYHDDKADNWQSIALNNTQLQRLSHGSWETFHRRFIWFPSLNPYAYALESGRFPADAWARKVKLAAEEVESRKKYDRENLRDFLENYRYRDKDVFNATRLPKGLLNDYV